MKNVPGNYYDKHNSKNPLVKYLMKNFHKVLINILKNINPSSILDVGCGEGYTSRIILKNFKGRKFEGCDIEESMVNRFKKNNPGITVNKMSATNLKYKKEQYEVVIMNEVLEHLSEPDLAIKETKRVSKMWCIYSVPNEPYWRLANLLRLRYLKNLGNTPGHIQNFTRKDFELLLKKHFSKVRIKNAILWNFALCKK